MADVRTKPEFPNPDKPELELQMPNPYKPEITKYKHHLILKLDQINSKYQYQNLK